MKGKFIEFDGRTALRFERRYPHAPEDVWRALVEPESLAAWFPTRIDGERRAGAALRFVFEGQEGPALDGTIRVFEPPRRLEYTWGNDVLRFELSPDSGGCRLVFVVTVEQRSSAARDATGWHGCLENLGARLAGRAPNFSQEAFPALYREYSALLGSGDFPAFLKSKGASLAELLPNPALDGVVFAAPNGARFAVLGASGDGETAEHQLQGDAYIFVVEGTYTLRLGGNELVVQAGTELHVPGGGRVSGHVTRGARLFYAVEAPAR